MNALKNKKCKPCEGKTKPLSRQAAQKYLKQVSGWDLNATATTISRKWATKNFMAAVQFINRVAKIAEKEDHHPDIHLTGYRNLTIKLSTHKIRGLSDNDFIVAAKINALPIQLKMKK